jgi:hypothetical protein
MSRLAADGSLLATLVAGAATMATQGAPIR